MDLDRLDANKLLTFLAVAEAGGVTAASRRLALTQKFARHGITLNGDALDDPRRHLVTAPPARTRLGRAIGSLQETMDDLRHALQPA